VVAVDAAEELVVEELVEEEPVDSKDTEEDIDEEEVIDFTLALTLFRASFRALVSADGSMAAS